MMGGGVESIIILRMSEGGSRVGQSLDLSTIDQAHIPEKVTKGL